MLSDDRNFLTRERQDRLLGEAADDRLARLTPGRRQPRLRERVAKVLIVLATRIAPSARNASHGSSTVHG